MIPEFAPAVLLRAFPEHALVPGDVGTVVHVHNNGEGYEVEFIDAFGNTITVLTVEAADIRELQRTEQAIHHVRTA